MRRREHRLSVYAVTGERRGIALRFACVQRIEARLILGADRYFDDALLARVPPAFLDRAAVLVRERRFPDRNRGFEHAAIVFGERIPALDAHRSRGVRTARN